jgi:CheY-like chemotaxis protein
MSPEILARAPEPFFTTKGPGQGTGLGLAQVYGTVRQIGGDMVIASEQGKGTTVDLYLPRAEDVGTVGTPQVSEELPHPARRARILVVDDDAQVRTATVAMLAELGYDVAEADGPRMGLHSFEATQTPFDLVLADHAMPGMTGSELIARLHTLRPDLRSLLISGYAESVPEGSGPILRKPFTVRELGAAVARLLHAEEA